MGISSAGIGSGIDVETLISQLMSAERQPIKQLQSRQQSFQSKFSAFGSLKSVLSTLETKADTLGDINKLAKFAGTTSKPDFVGVATTSSATAGSYSINVTQLAKAHKGAFSTSFTSATQSVGTGSINISLSGPTTTVDLTTGSGLTLADVRDAINAKNAGVTATIEDTGAGFKLALSATDSGKTVSFSGTGFDAPIFTNLYSAESDPVGNGSINFSVIDKTTTINLSTGADRTLEQVRNEINASSAGVTATIVNVGTANAPSSKLVLKAADTNKTIAIDATGFGNKFAGFATINGEAPQAAKFTVDGLSVESDSNIVSDRVIGGVTLTLKDLGTSEITVARDNSAVKTAAEEFVKAYNDVVNNIKKATAYDATTKTGSALSGDSTARSIQGQLSNLLILTPSSLTNSDLRLADLGIQLNNDGTLKFDATKLETAVAKDFSAVTKALNAYGNNFETKAHALVSFDGLIASKQTGLTNNIKNIDNSVEALEYRMTQIEKRYRAQFSSLDVMMSQSTQTMNYLTQQLAAL